MIFMDKNQLGSNPALWRGHESDTIPLERRLTFVSGILRPNFPEPASDRPRRQ
jgi:hypothetical protein